MNEPIENPIAYYTKEQLEDLIESCDSEALEIPYSAIESDESFLQFMRGNQCH